MAKGSGKSLATIQRLVAERVQIEHWLERLDLAGDQTPEAVRERVKTDYKTRLHDVIKELASYGSELGEALKRQKLTRDGLARQEKEAAERLAEAEVRHAVGEYDEARWHDVHSEYLGTLVRIREELKNADDEIQRLDEVIQNLRAPATPAPAHPPPVASAPKPGQMDELAFLKSVTEDDEMGPSPARASGGMRSPEPIRPQAAPPPDPPRAAPPTPLAPPPDAPKPDIGVAGVAQIDTSGPGKRLTGMVEKTLKCKECGTLNMPTEWYCEKCGAELSDSL